MDPLTFVNIEWVKPLLKMLNNIRGQREKEVLALADVFGDPRVMLSYYVVPNCQHHNPADHDEDERSRSYVKAPVYDTLQAFLGTETLMRDGRNQCFILADAGMGKTTLLLMLKMWHTFAFWPKDYDCLLLKLGDNSLEQIGKHEGKASTVLLLDALDEDPKAHGRIDERLKELLEASRNYRQVLITCRTQFFPSTGLDPFGDAGRVTLGGDRCPMLFLSLFDDKQVETYLRKRFPDPWHSFFSRKADPRRLKAQTLLASMKSLRFRPLLLAHVDELLKAKERLSNPYEIFQALVRVWLVREIGKMEKQKLHPIPSEQDLWAACRLLAIYLQTIGKRELDAEALGELMRHLPAVQHLEKLDFGGRSLLNRNSKREYRFSHYSVQEFLVVHGLCHDTLQQDLDRCPEPARNGSIKLTMQMLGFLPSQESLGILRKYQTILNSQDLSLGKILEWVIKGELPLATVQGLPWHDELKVGGFGPAMVIVPAGTFWMGSKKSEKNARDCDFPRLQVIIGHPFTIGCYPVTFEDYDRYCEATGKDKPNDQGWGRGKRPVINVSWDDALAYCIWLSEQTGQPYRLPTEAEWEYAARAGTETAYWWGDDIGVNRANGTGSGSQWSGKQTSPMGSFPPNPFGLYDTLGNVWEWVQDRWHDNYQGAPADGRVWESGSSERRVVRGGSWSDHSGNLRCAFRLRDLPDFRSNFLGFRLVLGSPW